MTKQMDKDLKNSVSRVFRARKLFRFSLDPGDAQFFV